MAPSAPGRRVDDGVRALERWLLDRTRAGWAAREPAQVDALARRLVDAQAPGLARAVRRLQSIEDPSEVAMHVGRLHLLVCSFRRLSVLPPPLAADVAALLGQRVAKKEVWSSGERLTDRWWVFGARLDNEEGLSVRRIWLLGEASGRFGLLVDFAGPRRSLPSAPPNGSVIEAEAAFYPSAAPQRCLLGEVCSAPVNVRRSEPIQPWLLPLTEVWDRRRRALAAVPWLGGLGVGVRDVRLEPPGDPSDPWWLFDRGEGVALDEGPAVGPVLAAVSGGAPMGVLGELSDDRLRVLSVVTKGCLTIVPSRSGWR